MNKYNIVLKLFTLASVFFLVNCASSIHATSRSDKAFFVVPDNFDPRAIRFDDTVFLYSIPKNAKPVKSEQNFNGNSVTYALEDTDETRSTELYFVVFRNDMEKPIAETVAIIESKFIQSCGTSDILRNNVSQETTNEDQLLRFTFHCNDYSTPKYRRLVEQDVQIRVKDDYIYVAQATLEGTSSLTDIEIDLLTNIMVFNDVYPADTYVEILRTN